LIFPPPGRGRDLLGLGVGALLLFCVALGQRDLWNPNEPIYGLAVREMARHEAWLVPTVNGEEFAEKPILYFWAARLVALAGGGVDETTLRLPSALCGVSAVLLVYLLALGGADARRARLAAALFGTTYIVFWTARAVQMDLMLTCCTLGAVLASKRALDGAAPRTDWLLAGAAAGLGALAKGPLGLLLPALVVGSWAAASGRLRAALRGGVALAAPAALAVAAPWYLLLALEGRTDLLQELLLRQNFARFADPWDHAAPWWYYLANFWGDMAPWSLFLPLAARLPLRAARERDLDRLCWWWIGVVVLFFSASASKRSVYIMPVAPAVAILVSGLATRLLDERLERWRLRGATALLALFGLLALLAAAALYWRVLPAHPLVERPGTAVALLLVAGAAAILAGLLRRAPRAVVSAAALLALTVTLYLLAAVRVLPAIDVYKSARPFAEAVNARVGPDDPLRSYRTWRWRAAYPYYVGRTIPRLLEPDELRAYWGEDRRVFVIVERGEEQGFHRVVGEVEPLVALPIGSNRAALYSNRPDG
jgi:4-amino-4-deoxy-L-arabinose transferase-like glycosyltransferase